MSSFRIFTPDCKTNLSQCGTSITLNLTLDNDWDYNESIPPKNYILINTYDLNDLVEPGKYTGIIINIPPSPPAIKGTTYTCSISKSSIINNELYYVIADANVPDEGSPTVVPFTVNSCVTNTEIMNTAPSP